MTHGLNGLKNYERVLQSLELLMKKIQKDIQANNLIKGFEAKLEHTSLH